MVILITGASHTGKTLLAQRMLERFHYPYLSIDHLKMGLIRSGRTGLTPEDDEALTDELWPVVREMIKTVIENRQDLVVEGCYVPFGWRQDFDGRYLADVRFVCLAMTEPYIRENFGRIAEYESVIEHRFTGTGLSADRLVKDNAYYTEGFLNAGEQVTVIGSDFERTLDGVLGRPDFGT